MSRRTVKKYRERAAEAGWLREEELVRPEVLEEVLRQVEEARQLGPASGVEPWRVFVKAKRAEGVEIQALLGLLRERGYEGSYSSLRRFVARVENKPREVYVRWRRLPGKRHKWTLDTPDFSTIRGADVFAKRGCS